MYHNLELAGPELESAQAVALSTTRDDYALGRIDLDEMEIRMDAIIGLLGTDEMLWSLQHTSFVDITRMGDLSQRRLASGWRWP